MSKIDECVPQSTASGTRRSDFAGAEKSAACEGWRKELSGTLANDGSAWHEKQLIAAARSGDDAAFATLYKSHLAGIRTVGRAILGAHGDLDDLAQEVFFLAWKGLRTFRGDSTFRTWVISIARRRCFALLKQRKDQAWSSCGVAGERDPKLAEARFELARLVSGLTPSNRDLIEMNLEGFTDKQIAKEMSLTIRTVRGRRQRAVTAMRKKIQEAPEQNTRPISLMSSTQTSQEATTHMGPAASKKRPLKTRVVATPVAPAAEPVQAHGKVPDETEVLRLNLTPGSDLFEQLVAETEQLEYLAAVEQRAQFEAEIVDEVFNRMGVSVGRALREIDLDSSHEGAVLCRLVKVMGSDTACLEGCARLQRLRMGAHSRELRLHYLDASVAYFLPRIIDEFLASSATKEVSSHG